MVGIVAAWTWAKWTVQSWFLAKQFPARPGDDDQFAAWIHSTQCGRCLDYLDDEDDMKKLIDGKWTCGMCRKGREDA